MSRVFVVQVPAKRYGNEWRPTFDIAPAREFGKLCFLMSRPGNVYLDALPMVLRHMRDALKDFSDADYLLPTGEPVAIAAAAMIAGVANSGRVKVLKWNRLQCRYEVVQITLPELKP